MNHLSSSADSRPEQPRAWSQIVRYTLPVASAYVPLGAAKSMLILSTGVDWYWPIISAIVVFAGSLEYLLASFILGGFSFGTVVITSLLVNSRHLFYGLSYPLSRHRSLGAKLYGGFALTDEAYMLSCLGEGKLLNGPSLVRMQLLLQCWWLSGSIIGVVMFYLLPVTLKGFEFGLTAMFLILATDSIRTLQHYRYLLYAIAAILVALVVEQWFTHAFLIVALCLMVVILTIDFFVLQHSGTKATDDDQ